MEQKNKSNVKKAVYLVLGLLLVLGISFGGNLKYIADWSSAEMIGYNTGAILGLLGGMYLLFLSTRK